MAFFIKNFESITASLIQSIAHSTTALTDYNPGSKVRTILEAFAQELEGFYHQMFRGIMEAIDSAVFNSFDFPPLPAVAALGKVTFSLTVAGSSTPLAPTSNITIPHGFRVQIPVQSAVVLSTGVAPSGTTYAVTEDSVWLAGQTTVLVNVACIKAGKLGNTTSGSITGLVDSLPVVQGGQYRVTNNLPYTNGQDEETQTARKARFAKFIQSLGRGTLAALESSALTAVVNDADGAIQEQVKKVVAVEPYMQDGSLPVGHVNIYIFNGVGGTSSSLVTNCQKIIDGYIDDNGNRIAGYKSAGIIVKVQAAIEQPQAFEISVKMVAKSVLTSDVVEQIKAGIVRYISNLNPGDVCVYNKIIELVMDVDGVYNCLVTSPVGDVAAESASNVITVGSITIIEDTEFTVTSETYNT
jgi:uncharacterized phage protein gp47/JayE